MSFFSFPTRKALHNSTRYIHISSEKEEASVRPLPQLYTQRSDCCGCSACYAICPVGAISMDPDEEGYLYPVVDASLCVRCHKCMAVCPVKIIDEGKVSHKS